MRYLLDTNVWIAAIKGVESVKERLERTPSTDIVLSPIVLGELHLGVEKSQLKKKNAVAVDLIAQGFEVIPLTAETSRVYAQIRGQLEQRGKIIGANDLWIAAQALAEGVCLVTDNTAEFSRVSGLKWENWLASTSP
nr:Ribonuclease VapC2 [Cupriavidus sp.]